MLVMKFRELVRDYLTFSRKEALGFIITAIVILLVWFSPALVRPFKSNKTEEDTAWLAAVARLRQSTEKPVSAINETNDTANFSYEKSHGTTIESYAGRLFYFDPNSASDNDWRQLGLKEKTIHTIQNYLSKGGHFYKSEDLKKIYGLPPAEFSRLAPYIKIKANTEQGKSLKPLGIKERFVANTSRYELTDVNTADTTMFIALPGIGSKLASRIISFREKLGGFYSVGQIGEVYGLPDSTFEKIRKYLVITNANLRKININTASKDELRSHPYLRWNLANAIVEYRNQHGSFSSLDELKRITVITDDIFNRVKSYLTIE
jgi:competence protein ComEA